MKNNLKLLFFLLFAFQTSSFANQIKVLEKQSEYLKNQKLELQSKREKEWSELKYLELEKQLFLNSIDLIKEKKSERKKKYKYQIELEKIAKTKPLLKKQLREYEKHQQIMEANKQTVSNLEIETLKYNISKIKEKKLENENNEIYYKRRYDETEDIKEKIFKKNRELNAEIFEFKKAILQKETEIILVENSGEEIIKNKELELEILNINFLEEDKEFERQREERQKDLYAYSEKLGLINKEINLKLMEKEYVTRKIKAGLAKRSELFEKDMEILELELNEFDYESKIKYINMELEE